VSPVDAIADMVAPVVLISVGGLFSNGLFSADIANSKRLHELNSERLSLRGAGSTERSSPGTR
jgi:hypothetical protein